MISTPIEIELESLDNYMKNKNINFVDILKIDTEGYEYEILKGLKEKISKIQTLGISLTFIGVVGLTI